MERRIAIGTLVFTALAAAAGLGMWLRPDYDPFDWREGELVEPDPIETSDEGNSRYVPDGNGIPTVVSFKNAKLNECLLQRVVFKIKETKDTPHRPTKAGALPALPVTFTSKHYDRKKREFEVRFQKPQAVPGKEWATLLVSIVERGWVGHTYVGDITVFYNGNQSMTIRDVEVDVLPK
jgi:hypothetical protein